MVQPLTRPLDMSLLDERSRHSESVRTDVLTATATTTAATTISKASTETAPAPTTPTTPKAAPVLNFHPDFWSPSRRLRDARAAIASMAVSMTSIAADPARDSRLPPLPQPMHASHTSHPPLPPIQTRRDQPADHRRLPSWPHSPRAGIATTHLPPPPVVPPPRLPSASSLAYPASPSFPPPAALDPDPRDPRDPRDSRNDPRDPRDPRDLRDHRPYDGHLGVTVADLYRSSPASNAPPQPSPHLPSMRTLDSLDTLPPPPPQQPPAHSLGLSMPGPSMGMPNAPLPYMAMAPPSFGMGPHALPPFGLPGHPRDFQALRMASLGMPVARHKKEIKRRTKTGCMTCRRRRIKCDEAHPTCNNCKKSKRECAGYDPIFKQQPLSPHPLHTASSTTATATALSAAVPCPSGPSETATPSSGGTPAPSPIPITPTAAAAVAAAAAATASTASTLAAVKSPAAAASSLTLPPPVTSSPVIPNLYTSTAASSPAAAAAASLNAAAAAYNPTTYFPRSLLSPTNDWDWGVSGVVYKANMKVDEIISLAGLAPAAPTTPPTLEMLDDITKMYYEIYVPGLTTFFETSWYNFKPNSTVNPVSNLLNNKALIGLLSSFLSVVARAETGEAGMAAAAALETRVVWALAGMAYLTPATVNLSSDEPVASDDAIEARNRLAVIDALLSGGCVRTNPCMPPPRAGNPQRVREHQFWWWLAEYLRLQDESGLNNTPGNSLPRLREQALSRMRSLLDGLENRDVIYSIAILRHLSPRYPPAMGDIVVPPGHEDEADPRIKLAMATEFIRKEAQGHGAGSSSSSSSSSAPASSGAGFTNVVRHFADLGLKAFVQPGYNIRRT